MVDFDSNNLSWPPNPLILKDDTYKKFRCSYCKGILVNAHQADDCGCRFCLECLDTVFKKNIRKCPNCCFNFASEAKIPDRYLQRKLNGTIVICHLEIENRRCEWSGTLQDFRSHYNSHFKP